MSNVQSWRGNTIPEKVGTVKLKRAVTLHLVWGRLSKSSSMSAGSTVIVEPTSSRAAPRNVLVGRVVTPLWGDGWVPMKVINPSMKPITLRRNAKLVDVYPCLALEDLDDNITHNSLTTVVQQQIRNHNDGSTLKSLTLEKQVNPALESMRS